MLWNLLDSASSSGNAGGDWTGTIMLVVLIGLMVVFMVISRRSQKKRQDEQMKTLNAIQPGNKVKTIGGICGIVVEICDDDNTLVVETGTEKTGKSYIKFDKQAIYQTDAKAEEIKEEAKEETKEEVKEAAAEEESK